MYSQWVVSALLVSALALCWHDVTAAPPPDPWDPIVSDPVEKCLDVPSVPNFNVFKFAGKWYSAWAADYSSSVSCHIRKFIPAISVARFRLIPYNAVRYEYYDDRVLGIVPDLIKPGQLDPYGRPRFTRDMRHEGGMLVEVDSGGLKSKLSSMIVVATDYENYALLVDCLWSNGKNSVQSVVILTRDRDTAAKSIKFQMQNLEEAGLSKISFRKLNCPVIMM